MFVMMIASIVLAGSVSGTLDAMSLPSKDAVLLSNFGYNDGGKPVLGMIFGGKTEIFAAEKGEVIFTFDANDTASRLPSPLGAWTAIDHADGLITIYSRYADKPENKGAALTQVEKSQPIANAGISGWSQRDGFYFIIFDRRERHWINPAMIVTPVLDTQPPRIISVSLIDSQGITTQSNNLRQGLYTILVNAVSPSAAGNFLVPQRIICMINGTETGSLNFEAFSAKDGILMIYRNGLVPAKQVYSTFPAFETAEVFLPRGQVNMEIIVQDIVGNSRNLVSRLIVN
jgi:hypothetical protein